MKFKSVQSGVLKVAIIGIAIILGCVSGYYIYQMKKFKEIGEVAKFGFDNLQMGICSNYMIEGVEMWRERLRRDSQVQYR